MSYKKLIYKIVFVLLIAGFIPQNVLGIVLTGHFPIQQGRFWNFMNPENSALSTWAINGDFTHKNIGDVFVLMKDNGHFLSMRSNWEGLYVYGEYTPEGYMVSDTPLLYLPREMDVDKPVEYKAIMRVFTMPPGTGEYQETSQIQRNVSIRLKGIEDIPVGGQEIWNCAVIERVIHEGGETKVETLWLVPTIGPVNISVKKDDNKKIFNLDSYAGPGIKNKISVPTKTYFPLPLNTLWTYRSHVGKDYSIETKDNVNLDGVKTTPYVINIPEAINPNDTFYYAYTKEGLVLPQIFRSAMKSLTKFISPNPPVTVFPETLALGAYTTSISNPRICRWPSGTPSLDFFPEMRYSSIPLAIEDITVPAGTFQDCIKVSLFSISRTFNFKMEKIRTGYIWFAKDTGIVKQELVDLGNYFLPQRVNAIDSVKMWELTNMKTTHVTN